MLRAHTPDAAAERAGNSVAIMETLQADTPLAANYPSDLRAQMVRVTWEESGEPVKTLIDNPILLSMLTKF